METESQQDYSLSPPTLRSRRLKALLVALCAVVIVATAAWLSPSDEGVGTHRQLGLPQCGWILAGDVPCPTCGMTTAFSYTVRGNLISGIKTQPFGMLVAIVVVLTGLLGFTIALTGRPVEAFWYRWMTTKTILIVSAMAAFAWVYKILAHRGWFS